MRFALGLGYLFVVAFLSANAFAQDDGRVRPNLIIEQIVEGLPRDERQLVRVLTASFKPGDKTVPHTHSFPVTVYVLQGAFTLEMKDHASVTVKAGDAMVEPPNVEMTGYNRSAEETKVVIFYVSAPNTPFLDPLH